MKLPQWVNTSPDEAAVYALLERVATRLPVDAIDEVWIFPTRRIAGAESTVIVISTFDENTTRRRVNTAHFTATRDKKGLATVQERVEQHAIAPVDAVPRVVEGAVRRFGDDLATPRAERIEGDAARWLALLHALGAPASAEPGRP